MGALAAFLKKHTLWVGFLAVLLPLLVMLGVQFVWLARLEQVSAIARKVTHSNYLEAIGTEVQFYYRSTAERALNIPATLFVRKRLDEAAIFWKKKPVQGVRRLFLVDFTRDPFGNYLVFDADRAELNAFPASDEALAIIVACTRWQVLSYRHGVAQAPALRVDEHDPEFRLILNPITDDASHVVGVAGLVLDQDYFKTQILPAVIKKTLPAFFPGGAAEAMGVTVRDAAGRVVVAKGEEPGREGDGQDASATARFPFVFTDWTMSLHGPGTTPEQWARANFAFNVALSVLLAVVLMGGIALALRAASRAVRLSEMKSDFVSNVSHELRTPLASIRVFAELLRLGRVQSSEKIQEYGEYIEAESRRLSRLIDNILDFARIESGRRDYRFVPADLSEVVAGTVRTFETHLRHGGFRVVFEGMDGSLPQAELDPDAIGQALHNLLDNAVKYSGDSKEIAVRLAREGDEAVLSVRDHGIGIPRAEQRKIFDRFHRVGTGLVHEVKGSGLGLSIVQHIVQVHGGRVVVESEPGKGSTFTIRLPLGRRGPAGAAAAAPGEIAASGPATGGPRPEG
ncbi:MAG TPA: HAMP domain-containing sensor histidine kinase [Candidatus Dormibacteraeota bacterium]|nr:HAMP domain-containing sensor histidine kinase [Candidatus Dormibacteraeota bacterium]